MKNLGAISCFAFGFAGLVSASNAAQMDAKQLEETRGVSQALLEEDEMSLKVTDRVSFLGEYGRQVEEVSPNVFLFVDGLFKGTTVAFGLSGLNYDIATLNEQLMREPGVSNQAVLSQELGRLNALAESFEKEQGQSKISNSRYGFCTIWDNSTFPSTPYHTNYTLTVVANAGLYLDRGDGSFNRYYARAQAGSSANWSGYLPWNVSRPVGGVGDRKSVV